MLSSRQLEARFRVERWLVGITSRGAVITLAAKTLAPTAVVHLAWIQQRLFVRGSGLRPDLSRGSMLRTCSQSPSHWQAGSSLNLSSVGTSGWNDNGEREITCASMCQGKRSL